MATLLPSAPLYASTKWIQTRVRNGFYKKGGGIIGITRTNSALSRWALSFSLRSHLAHDTKTVFGVASHDDYVHNETTKGRMKLDSRDEHALLTVLQSFGLFSDKLPQTLQNIANKDLATQDIEDDLLTAAQKGQDQLGAFVEERLLPTEERRVSFWDRLQQNKYLTFATLYKVRQSDAKSSKAKTVKADRNCERRVFVGCTVILFTLRLLWGAPEFQGAYHRLFFKFCFSLSLWPFQ